jgi:cytochrome oxidase Cu insertion factor (SCO1/SenC/PrrC family)
VNPSRTIGTPSSPIAWLVGRWWFWILAVLFLFGTPLVRTFVRHAPGVPPVGAALPPFQLTRENGAAFDPSVVSGRVWVASWIVPGDPDADATLEAMFKLQHRLRNMGDAVRLVTFSAQPSTPQIMEGLGRAHHYNARVWLFATGAGLGPLREAFGVLQPRSEPFLWLIDGKGHLRGAFARENLDRLVEDLSVLVNGS